MNGKRRNSLAIPAPDIHPSLLNRRKSVDNVCFPIRSEDEQPTPRGRRRSSISKNISMLTNMIDERTAAIANLTVGSPTRQDKSIEQKYAKYILEGNEKSNVDRLKPSKGKLDNSMGVNHLDVKKITESVIPNVVQSDDVKKKVISNIDDKQKGPGIENANTAIRLPHLWTGYKYECKLQQYPSGKKNKLLISPGFPSVKDRCINSQRMRSVTSAPCVSGDPINLNILIEKQKLSNYESGSTKTENKGQHYVKKRDGVDARPTEKPTRRKQFNTVINRTMAQIKADVEEELKERVAKRKAEETRCKSYDLSSRDQLYLPPKLRQQRNASRRTSLQLKKFVESINNERRTVELIEMRQIRSRVNPTTQD